MTRRPELEDVVRSWLREDGHEDADRVLFSVLDELDTTPQRHAGRLARRFPTMNRSSVRYGLAAAAVVLVGIIGWQLLPNLGPDSVGPPSSAVPSAQATPVVLTEEDVGRELNAGRHSIRGPMPGPAIISLPEGWSVIEISQANAEISGPGEGAYPYLGFFRVHAVYVDPCHPGSGSQSGGGFGPVGFRDFDALVDALDIIGNAPGFEVTTPIDTTVAGLPAKYMQMSNTVDTESAGCTEGALLPLFDDGSGEPQSTNGGTTQLLWVVDMQLGVGSDRPLLIVGEAGHENRAENEAILEAIVGSLMFDLTR